MGEQEQRFYRALDAAARAGRTPGPGVAGCLPSSLAECGRPLDDVQRNMQFVERAETAKAAKEAAYEAACAVEAARTSAYEACEAAEGAWAAAKEAAYEATAAYEAAEADIEAEAYETAMV